MGSVLIFQHFSQRRRRRGPKSDEVKRFELSALRKGEPRKVRLAMLLRKRTIASNAWIAERLAMGEAGSVSRLVGQGKATPGTIKKLKELEEMLK
jgi:hypothetical protein